VENLTNINSHEVEGYESVDLEILLSLKDLEIEDLDISEFLDETRLEESEIISKVMSASCTTCECCCSCCSS